MRAADQLIPGATVTASQGTAKVVAYTDENGRYSMNLPAGVWEIKVEMLGFTTAVNQITIGNEPDFRNWTLEMPKAGQQTQAASTTSADQNGGRRQSGRGRGRGFGGQQGEAGAAPGAQASGQANAAAQGQGTGRGGQSQFGGRGGLGPGRGGGPAFQSAQANATQQQQQQQDPQQSLADAAAGFGGLDVSTADADQAFLVNGSTSGGLAAASDDEARRQRDFGGRGGPGGRGGADALASLLGTPPGMGGPAGDALGLGGFGAAAIDGGFNAFEAGPAGGGFGGPGGGPGGPGGAGGGFGGGGGRGGGRGGGGGGGGRGQFAGRQGRGPFNGNFATFGNRRRQQPAYTGSLFINLANSALNASPFSLNGVSVAKPSSSREQFGVNFGGPLIIPKLLNWRRANFYFTYQGLVSRNPFNQAASLPTQAERSGDFSQAMVNNKPVTIYDPLSGLPFPGNVIPLTRINPASLALLQYFPSPMSSGLIQNYNLVGSTPNNNNNIGTRLNMPLNRKDRLNFNVQFQKRSSETLQLFGFRDDTAGSGLSAQAGWNHSFAPRFNNSASVTLSRNNNTLTPYFAYTNNVAAELGIQGTSQAPINYGPPNLSFTNFGALTDGSASVTRNQTMTFTDALTFVFKKKHNLSFGYTYNRLQQNSLTYQNARGAYSFSGLVTSGIGSNGQPVSGTGFDFADFLLGFPQSASLRYGSDNNYFRSWSTAVYAQDDFRVSRNLSLNFGLRYEYFAPYTELYGHLANIDINSSFTQAAIVTAGAPGPFAGGLPSSLVRSDPNAFSPRFGFAWRPFEKHSTQIRGGYSIFYSGSAYAQIASQMASQPPFATTGSLSTSLGNPLTIENGFISIPSGAAGSNITNTYAVDPNYKLAYAQQWVFAIQNTLPHGFLIETEYLGTKGTHLGIYEQPNQALAGTSVLTAQNQLRIPYATGFNYQTDGANSSFNAGQIRVTRRFQRGMSFVALYTYSKSIDNASSFTGTGGTLVQFVNDWQLERGLSSTDQRHRLNLTYTLSSPVGVNGMMRNGGWKTALLAGWTLNGNFAAQSGTPLTAKLAGNLSNTGGIGALGSLRAEATGLPIDGGPNSYFNPLAFTAPAPGQYGNAGRDTIPGPFQTSLNASLNRAFRFGESRRQLQLRLSANNVFNHVIVTGFGTSVNSTNYGLATAASATRTVNLLLRFNF